jgi:hypothetical protein
LRNRRSFGDRVEVILVAAVAIVFEMQLHLSTVLEISNLQAAIRRAQTKELIFD